MQNRILPTILYAISALLLAAFGSVTAAEYPFLSEPQTLIQTDTAEGTISFVNAAPLIAPDRGLNEALVIWIEDTDRNSFPTQEVSVRGQRISLDTGTFIGPEVIIATSSEPLNSDATVRAGAILYPANLAVAADPAQGRYAVIWRAEHEQAGTAGGGMEYFGRTLDAGDGALGNVKLVSDVSTDDDTDSTKNSETAIPALVFSPFDNRYLFAWNGQYNTSRDLYLQSLDPETLAPLANEHLVYRDTSREVENRSVIGLVANPVSSEWFITWQIRDDNLNPYIAGKRLDEIGAPIDDPDVATEIPMSNAFRGALLAYDPTPGIENSLAFGISSAYINRLGFDGDSFALTNMSGSQGKSKGLHYSERTALFLLATRLTGNPNKNIARLRLFDSESALAKTDAGPFDAYLLHDDQATFADDFNQLVLVPTENGTSYLLLYVAGDGSSTSNSTQIKMTRINTQWGDMGISSDVKEHELAAGGTFEWPLQIRFNADGTLDERTNRALDSRIMFSFDDEAASVVSVEGCMFDADEQVCVLDEVLQAADAVSVVATVRIQDSATGTIRGTADLTTLSHDPVKGNDSAPIAVVKPVESKDPDDPDDPGNPDDPSNPDNPGTPSSGGGGGPFGWLTLGVLAIAACRRTRLLA